MRKSKKYYWGVTILTLIMIFGFAAFCMASGEGGGAVHKPSGETPVFGNLYVIGWSLVNFLVLVAMMQKFAYGPISAMLAERTNTIEGSLKHAEEVKVEVELMRKETQANLAESRKEAQEIVARATKAADEAKNEILANAKDESTAIKAKAAADIKAATEAAKLELKDATVSIAMLAAEKVLGRAITENDHKQMVKQFVNEAGDLLC